MLVLNDLHVGVNRSGGTTQQSQAALRNYLLDNLASILDKESGPVVINGDLFDGFTVDTKEVVRVAHIFDTWLGTTQANKLHLVAGNHDYNPRGDKLSSFHLLCYILNMVDYGQRFRTYDRGLAQISDNVWCIPHMPNQELFNLEVAEAIQVGRLGQYLLLHCNYKNGFAESSDHSLNLSDDQVANLMRAGWTLLLGHEHIGYSLRGGRVVVAGNQFPSSIADCLGNTEKFATRITDTGLQFERTWTAEGSYAEVDWRELTDLDGLQFIRVTGDATAAEAADVIKVVSRLRQTHDAYVIANAVKVEGHAMSDEMTKTSIESIKSFDVVGSIMAELNEREQETVKGLLKC
jgi:hypothetical protein